jgi:putative membrane protein
MAVVIVLLIVFIIAGIFSFQNAVPVTVTFISWKFEASLAIVMLLSVLGGIIAGAILMLLIRFKRPAKKATRNV